MKRRGEGEKGRRGEWEKNNLMQQLHEYSVITPCYPVVNAFLPEHCDLCSEQLTSDFGLRTSDFGLHSSKFLNRSQFVTSSFLLKGFNSIIKSSKCIIEI